jgi:DNA-binding XRE family transcriptional regulator
MTSEEMKAIRKGTGLSQQGIASELGVSRKTINELENGAAIDRRTELAMQTLARKIKLTSDVFWVEDTIRGTHIVVRRTVQEHDRPDALYYGRSLTMLYGEFKRREHAERWWRALSRSDNPRNTRKLLRQRETEQKQRALADIA